MTLWRLRISDVLADKILVNRESARALEGPIRQLLSRASAPEAGNDAPTIDFAGIEGVTPSFLDELLSVLEELVGVTQGRGPHSLRVENPPTRLSSKFQAVARGHALAAADAADGSWLLTAIPQTGE